MSDSDKVSKLIHDYALRKYQARLTRAVEAGIIEGWQMDALVQMWHEEHTPEPFDLFDDGDDAEQIPEIEHLLGE